MSKIGGLIKGIFSGQGGLIKNVKDLADEFIHTKEEKNQFNLKAQEVIHKQELEALEKSIEIEKGFNERTIKLEGTASELKGFGLIGNIIVFLRAAFRPLFSYGVGFTAIMVFMGYYELPEDESIKKLFNLICGIVIVFYFGERAVKNVIPLIGVYMGGSKIKTSQK